jgi:hypothetical protein
MSLLLLLKIATISFALRADIGTLPPPPPVLVVSKPAETEAPPAATLPTPATSSVVPVVAPSPASEPEPAPAATPTPDPAPSVSAPLPVAESHSAVVSSAQPVAVQPPAPALVPSVSTPATGLAEPLFASDKGAAEVSVGGKEAYEKTTADRDAAQTALAALEKAKSDSMDSYLAFDKELDDLYDEAGVARGSALADLADAKQHILDNLHPKEGVDNATQEVMAEQGKLLDALGKEIESLQEVEAKVIAALKVVSDYVLTLSEEMETINLNRMALMNAIDQASVTDLSTKIKKAADVIVAADKSANAAGGQIVAYTAALTVGKDKIAAIKKIAETVKQKNINIADAVSKVAQRIDNKNKENQLATGEEKKTVNDHGTDKKKSKKMTKSIASWVRGTVFEAPYNVFVVLWDALMPVRTAAAAGWSAVHQLGYSYWYGQDDKSTGISSEPLNDPVLERIRLERTQSHKKVKSLQLQREVIEMKSTLLDRLEAERIMQLDTKEGISAEISRAYARKDRELSWVDLCKRIVWKLYATLRRTLSIIITWLTGPSIDAKSHSDGVGEPKNEGLIAIKSE